MLIWENNRCSILFHLLVPGGRWQTKISRPVLAANAANSSFHSHGRFPFDPPQSAVIISRRAFGYFSRPISSHHLPIEATANCDVSWSVPTDTQAELSARS